MLPDPFNCPSATDGSLAQQERNSVQGVPDSDGPLSLGASPFSELTFPEALLACSPLVKSVFSGVVGLLCAWLCFK